MSRQLRIEYPGAWYHVMNRGAARRAIFDSDELRKQFLALLQEAHKRYQLRIHAYCLMGNHYHLLVNTPQGNLSQSMCYIDGLYARKFNINHKRDGPLFRGRYRAILVEDDRYRLNVSRYIHLNPVEAKLANEPSTYPWSSMPAYSSKDNLPPEWLNLGVIHSYFDQEQAHRQYREFISEGVDAETDEYYKLDTPLPIFGSLEFINEISETYAKPVPQDSEVPKLLELKNYDPISVRTLLAKAAATFNVPVVALTESYRGFKNPLRDILIVALIYHTELSLTEIAQHFNMKNYASASKAYRRGKAQIENDESIRTKYFSLIENLFN